MLGITAIGRATVALLQTNREGVINMRRVLAVMDEHPPDYSPYSPPYRRKPLATGFCPLLLDFGLSTSVTAS